MERVCPSCKRRELRLCGKPVDWLVKALAVATQGLIGSEHKTARAMAGYDMRFECSQSYGND
jgi:hypothetical protein